MRLILAAIVLMSAYSSGALACSCVRQSGDERAAVATALEKANLVFVGRIESKEKFSVDEQGDDIEFERIQFYVVQSWKGDKASRVYVETSITCCLCGYEFPKAGSFLVYAYGPDENGYYSTSICSRTKALETAKDEIAILDEIIAEAGQTKRSIPSGAERTPVGH